MSCFSFLCHHKKGTSIFLQVDGNKILCENNGTVSIASLILNQGEHEITIIKSSIIYKWYWWLNIFNIFYVFALLKNRTDGRFGYNHNFASCTLKIVVDDNDSALEIELLEIEYNKYGRQGTYFSWGNTTIKNIIIENIKSNKMPKYLIRRWRIMYGLPTLFCCLLIYLIIIIEIIKKDITFNFSVLFLILISALYALYILILFFRIKSVEENIEIAKKKFNENRYK